MGRDSLSGINTHGKFGSVYFAIGLKEHWLNDKTHRHFHAFTKADPDDEDYKESLKSDTLITPLTLIEWND